MKCSMCLAGFPSSCQGGSCGSTPTPDVLISIPTEEDNDDLVTDSKTRSLRSGRNTGRNGNSSGRRDAVLKDQQSTGRKRAARLYPLNRESPCEWQGFSSCGGGLKPILGCVLGKQEARHHGPDKSVSNNEEGNVHRICHACHNRWHAANNAEYDWNSTLVQAHNPRPQSPKERGEAMTIHMTYTVNKAKRIKD